MKANMIIFLSILISFWNTYTSLSQSHSDSDNTGQIHQLHREIAKKYVEPGCNYLKSVKTDSLIKVIKKDTILGIDMGSYVLPSSWRSTQNGLAGPDGTRVKDHHMVSEVISYSDCKGSPKLDAQAIIKDYLKENILTELRKDSTIVRSIYPDISITEQYQKNFTALYPCSAPPVHFETQLVESTDLSGYKRLTMLHFMVYKSTYAFVLHFSKHELTARPEYYKRDKRDYLYGIAHSAYTPEYISKAHQIQRENPQDLWFQYNEQLVSNKLFDYRDYSFKPDEIHEIYLWKRHDCGKHDEYINYLDTTRLSKNNIYYDPQN